MRFDCMAVGLVGPDRQLCGWARPSVRAFTRARAIAKAARRAAAKKDYSVVVVSRRGTICGHVIQAEIHKRAPDLIDLLAHAATTRVTDSAEFEAALDHQRVMAGARDLDLDFQRYGLR